MFTYKTKQIFVLSLSVNGCIRICTKISNCPCHAFLSAFFILTPFYPTTNPGRPPPLQPYLNSLLPLHPLPIPTLHPTPTLCLTYISPICPSHISSIPNLYTFIPNPNHLSPFSFFAQAPLKYSLTSPDFRPLTFSK